MEEWGSKWEPLIHNLSAQRRKVLLQIAARRSRRAESGLYVRGIVQVRTGGSRSIWYSVGTRTSYSGNQRLQRNQIILDFKCRSCLPSFCHFPFVKALSSIRIEQSCQYSRDRHRKTRWICKMKKWWFTLRLLGVDRPRRNEGGKGG